MCKLGCSKTVEWRFALYMMSISCGQERESMGKRVSFRAFGGFLGYQKTWFFFLWVKRVASRLAYV